jgi:hypothetical protein
MGMVPRAVEGVAKTNSRVQALSGFAQIANRFTLRSTLRHDRDRAPLAALSGEA